MTRAHNHSAAKKPANLSLNQELLAEARRLKINLSATLEKALTAEIKARQEQEWLEKNSESLEACNDFSDKHGLFSDSFRGF